jgi:hypothetical protein
LDPPESRRSALIRRQFAQDFDGIGAERPSNVEELYVTSINDGVDLAKERWPSHLVHKVRGDQNLGAGTSHSLAGPAHGGRGLA